jgi:hypothetical protein
VETPAAVTAASEDRAEALEGRVRELEAALAAAERDRAQLRQDLDWCRYPEDTPWGQVLRLDELDGFDERTLRGTKALIEEQCPIPLQPGEPSWIATRYRDNDWPEETVTLSLIRFLGPERLLREAPERIRDDLVLIYPDEFQR